MISLIFQVTGPSLQNNCDLSEVTQLEIREPELES